MRKVLLISHSQKVGGAEKCLVELASGLLKCKFNVCVVLPSKNDNYTLFNKIGCSIMILPYPWWVSEISNKLNLFQKIRKYLSFIKAIITFFKIIDKFKPDIVISNTICVPFGAIVSKVRKKKHYFFIHELGREDHGLKFDLGINLSAKIISYCSNMVFVNSGFVFNYYSNFINKSKLKVINIDVPVNNYLQKKITIEDDYVDLFVIGQIQAAKCQMDAILAHEILINRGIKSRLYIIGNRTNNIYYNQLLEYINNNLIPNILFFDHLDDPFIYITNKSIGIICSEYEAFGRITIEFMKLKIPIIAKYAGNNINLVKHNINGLTYSRNKIDELVECILLYHNYQNLKIKIIDKAFELMKNSYNNEEFIKLIKEEF
jgi:glycosyltransferase involved in cell wall biosynthesis